MLQLLASYAANAARSAARGSGSFLQAALAALATATHMAFLQTMYDTWRYFVPQCLLRSCQVAKRPGLCHANRHAKRVQRPFRSAMLVLGVAKTPRAFLSPPPREACMLCSVVGICYVDNSDGENRKITAYRRGLFCYIIYRAGFTAILEKIAKCLSAEIWKSLQPCCKP